MKNFKLETPELSDNPGTAILQCLEDLEACEKHPAYKINMQAWHHPSGTSNYPPEKQICHVCLGGARLARMYHNPHLQTKPEYLPDKKEQLKIEAMDYFRTGSFSSGIMHFCFSDETQPIPEPSISKLRKIRDDWMPYGDGPSTFKNNLRKMAKILEKEFSKRKGGIAK